jgi:hypothetical protein
LTALFLCALKKWDKKGMLALME